MKSKRTRLRMLFTVVMLLIGHPRLGGWVAGAILLVAGSLLHALGAGYLTKGTALASAGPYRFVRNPLYVGDMLRDVGLLLACHASTAPGALWVWLVAAGYFAAMFLGLIRPRVLRREEPELLGRFGEAYRDYCRRVPRFVPRLTPAAPLGPGRFSWATLHRNHELARFAGMLVLVGATYFRWELVAEGFDLGGLLEHPVETAAFLALPLALVVAKIQGRELGWPPSVPLGAGRFVFRARDVLAAAPLVYALASVRWEWEWDPGIWSLALLLALAAVALRAVCAQHRVGGELALATTGPYARLRNPRYAANVLLLSGATVASELLWLVPAAALWALAIYTLAARYEEELLLAHHGERYRAYAGRVSRWWPRRAADAADAPDAADAADRDAPGRAAGDGAPVAGSVSHAAAPDPAPPSPALGPALAGELSRLLVLAPFVAKELGLLGLGSGG